MTTVSGISTSPIAATNSESGTTEDPVVLASQQHFMLPSEDGPPTDASMAVVVQDTDEPMDAIETALEEAGVNDLSDIGEIAVVEIPPPFGSSGDDSMFVVLWGHAVHSLHWLDSLPVANSPLPGVEVADTSGLRPEVMSGVLATGNMAFGVIGEDGASPHYSLNRWLAVANPSRAAWDALDRFFMGMHKNVKN